MYHMIIQNLGLINFSKSKLIYLIFIRPRTNKKSRIFRNRCISSYLFDPIRIDWHAIIWI